MGMMGQRRAPGVKHGGQADAGAEMLRIGGDGDQGLGGGLEQDAIDRGLVLVTVFRVLRAPTRLSVWGNRCQSALNFDPLSASNIDPSCVVEEVVPVVHRGDPRGFV